MHFVAGCGLSGVSGTYKECSSCTPEECEDEDKCMLQYGKCTPKASLYNSCIISDDCKSAGNLCYNRHDVKCICKSGQCKVSCK